MTPPLTNNHNLLWQEIAQKLPWFTPWHTLLTWQEPIAQWFVGGTINASYACVDVHMQTEQKNKIAIYWEGEDGKPTSWTYEQLYDEVNRCAYALQKLGVTKGDIVILYLPMIPESVAAMLAVARLGAIHSVVFSGFSGEALKSRINDAQAKFIITSDFSYRRGKTFALQNIVNGIIDQTPSVTNVMVIRREQTAPKTNQPNKNVFYEDLVQPHEKPYIKPVAMDSEAPLFILYTSGTTGSPKGIVHATGGYLTYIYATFKWAFDPQPNSVYWCTADIGWITGHSYVAYAPLMHGVTIVMQEGTLDYPDAGRWWQIIERYKVSVFYTSPTALRMCIKNGDQWPEKYDLSSLKTLGSVGEPINPPAWHWFSTIIGKDKCPIIDTWWQTETGGFMIAPTPKLNHIKLKPGSATMPLPSIDAAVVDELGNLVPPNTKGYLVICKPWPGMAIGILNDAERFKKTYWSKFKGMYYTGDYALCDADGYFWLLGRADEVVNIAAHRIGTIELESAIVELPEFVEAAAIGISDEISGEAIVIFAIVKPGITIDIALKDRIKNKIHTTIGRFITPKEIYFVEQLPKTRSGKIMRRLLKAILEEKTIGDVSTLEDGASIDEIKKIYDHVKQKLERIPQI